MAQAIAKAIVDYKTRLEKTVVTTDTFSQTQKATVTDTKQEPAAVEVKEEDNDIYFRVQIAASKKSIDTKPQNFKGLNPIFRLKEGGYYKYYFAKAASYKQIQKDRKKARRSGFKSAFNVAFRGQKKIKLNEALGN